MRLAPVLESGRLLGRRDQGIGRRLLRRASDMCDARGLSKQRRGVITRPPVMGTQIVSLVSFLGFGSIDGFLVHATGIVPSVVAMSRVGLLFVMVKQRVFGGARRGEQESDMSISLSFRREASQASPLCLG